jgi:hypothetical protein
MEPRNKYILPFIGLILPLIFYFFVGSFIAPILTSLQISNDILLAVIGFVYLIVISYSSQEASSQSKYFKKALERSNSTESEPEENREISDSSKVTKRRGTCFFIHVAGNLVAIAMWIFLFPEEFSESIGVFNVWYQIVVLIVLMFICSNIFKLVATNLLFKVSFPKALNSIKFVLFSDLFWYGLISAYYLYLGGFFF